MKTFHSPSIRTLLRQTFCRSSLSTTLARFALTLLALSAASAVSRAAILTWDATPNDANPGPQDGPGSWSTLASNTNWWDGAANVGWNNATPDSAIFGAGTGDAGNVTIPSSTTNSVGNITFNAPGSGNYTIAASSSSSTKLNLVGTPIFSVASGLSPTITVTLMGTTFTKDGPGMLTVNPGSPVLTSGSTLIREGTLVIGTSSSGRLVIPGDLTVTNGATAILGNSEQITNVAKVVVSPGCIFDMNGRSETVTAFTLDNATIIQSGSETLIVTDSFDARSGSIAGGSGKLDAGQFTKSTSGTMLLGSRGSSASGGGLTNTIMNGGDLVFDYVQNSSKLLDTGTLTVNGGNLILTNGSHAEVVGTFTLAGGVITNAGGTAGTSSLRMNSGSFDVRNGAIYARLEGAAGLTKSTAGTVTLGFNNTYTGPTTISAGTLALVDAGAIASSSMIDLAAGANLDATGRTDGTLAMTSGKILKGNGTVSGNVTIANGATLAAGASVGKITINGSLSFSSSSTNEVEIDKLGNTNDVVSASGGVNYDGRLRVVLLSGSYAAGDSFLIFNPPGSGSFGSIVPPTPDAGLEWDTSTLASDGRLRVSAGGGGNLPLKITSTTLVANTLTLQGGVGTNGGPFTVRSNSNVAAPLGSWGVWETGSFDGSGNFSVSGTVPTGQRFFIIQQP